MDLKGFFVGFTEFEERIKYSFYDKGLLNEALTHSSKGDIRPNGERLDYERLEFIGDAMLDAIVGVMLYKRLTSKKEGELTKLRAQIVCEDSLNTVGQKLGIGSFLRMGEGEEKTDGRNKPSVVADSVEALIGAIYLDAGYYEAEAFVKREFSELISDAIEGKLFRDYKTRLQEIAQKNDWHIEYRAEEEGPDHDKTFFVHLMINGIDKGYGVGKSKKEAEQNAAEDFLRKA